MKKVVILFGMLVILQGCANAETKFTPLDFSSNSINIAAAPTPATTSGKTVSGVEAKGTDLLDPSQVTGGSKMQSAISQIDNAQVEVRSKLMNYKNSYAEIDARYNVAKAQRKEAKKQIRLAEKKINNLEKAKQFKTIF